MSLSCPSIREKVLMYVIVIGSLFIFFIRWRKFPSIPSFLIVLLFKIRNRYFFFLTFWLRSGVGIGVGFFSCSAYVEMIPYVSCVDLLRYSD